MQDRVLILRGGKGDQSPAARGWTQVTPQEEQLLNSLAERVNQTQLQEKDPDAEALLNRELGGNQDALYILAQSVLVQNIALEQAKAQVTQLQQRCNRRGSNRRALPAFWAICWDIAIQRRRRHNRRIYLRSRAMCRLRLHHRGMWTPNTSSNTLQRASRASCAGPCRRLRAWRLERLLLKAWSRSCMGLVDSDIPDLDGVADRGWAWAALAWGREWG